MKKTLILMISFLSLKGMFAAKSIESDELHLFKGYESYCIVHKDSVCCGYCSKEFSFRGGFKLEWVNIKNGKVEVADEKYKNKFKKKALGHKCDEKKKPVPVFKSDLKADVEKSADQVKEALRIRKEQQANEYLQNLREMLLPLEKDQLEQMVKVSGACERFPIGSSQEEKIAYWKNLKNMSLKMDLAAQERSKKYLDKLIETTSGKRFEPSLSTPEDDEPSAKKIPDFITIYQIDDGDDDEGIEFHFTVINKSMNSVVLCCTSCGGNIDVPISSFDNEAIEEECTEPCKEHLKSCGE